MLFGFGAAGVEDVAGLGGGLAQVGRCQVETEADQFLFGTLGLALVAPGKSVQDINDSADGQMLSGERLVSQTTSLEPKDLGLNFAIPIFFLQGAEDFTTPTELARRYLASIKAPRKEFVPLKGGGHFAVFMNSGQFLEMLVKRVRPLGLRH